MAKKVVASLRKEGGRNYTKCIKMVKSEKSGSYTFKTEILNNTEIKDFFNGKK
ncbi:MAG: DUF4295 domain-containing protein [Bacteroidetes bacterium]|nr:DUF4295 domain-containing protein [Bacteroidota bacterium]